MRPSKRFYKIKNPKLEFLCPLCGAQRAFRYRSQLSSSHYLQIAMISLVFCLLTFSWLGMKSLLSLFFVWASFEFINKLNFRKEIPCPHCGLDATWYKRDVKVARRLVQDFWKNHSHAKDQTPPMEQNV